MDNIQKKTWKMRLPTISDIANNKKVPRWLKVRIALLVGAFYKWFYSTRWGKAYIASMWNWYVEHGYYYTRLNVFDDEVTPVRMWLDERFLHKRFFWRRKKEVLKVIFMPSSIWIKDYQKYIQ